MSNSKLQVTLLADEWKSSKGGLSTINRELAIHLAEHPNVSVTFLVPECTEDDKNESSACNVRIVRVQEYYAFNLVDLLSFPPDDLSIDIIIGHGVKLGKHAQIIKKSHKCKWVQVVHTAPEELSLLKTYSDCDNAIAKGDEKQWNEIKLCERADLVVTVGPRLWESYSRYLSLFGKHVFNLTPGIFSELSSLKLSIVEGKRFNVLLFGRGDSEDFELKGFDIAAKAVAQLNDTSYQLVFVGAPSGNEKQVAEKLLGYGLRKNQLIVKPFLENRKDLATLLSTADLAIIPSRSEGFGLTALEVLSAGRPFLVTQTSGFGEALQDALPQSTPWVVDSEEPEKWAEAIKSVREKGREAAIAECQTLRESYGKKYIWESQCRDLVEKMVSLANASPSKMELSVTAAPSQRLNEASIVYRPDEKSFKTHPEVKNAQLKNESELASSARSPLPEDQSMTEQKLENQNGGRREGFAAHDFETKSGRKLSCFNSQGTTPEKNLSSTLERPKASGSKIDSSVTAAPSQSLSEAFNVHHPDDQRSKTHLEVKTEQLKDELDLSSSTRSSLPDDQRLTEQRLEELIGGRREGFTANDFETTYERKSSYLSSQETTPEKNMFPGFERPKASGSKMESSLTDAPSQSLNKASIVYLPDEKSTKTHTEVENAQLKDESELASSARSPLPKDQRLSKQRLEVISGGRREGFTAHDFETIRSRKSSYFNNQETTPEKNLSSGLERPKDLAVLGVSLTERSMKDVKKVFQGLAPKLNLSESPPMKNIQSVPKVKDYLMEKHFELCVLVIDAGRITFDRGHQLDYRQLFETVANHVDRRVLVLICGSSFLSKQDEVRVEKVVKDLVNNKEKIVTGWLKHGMIDLEPDVLAQLLTPTSDVTRRVPNPNQGNSPERGLRRETNKQVQTQQARGATANYPATTERAHQGTIVLECELSHGQISERQLNRLKQSHDFKVVDSIDANLFEKYCGIPLASVKFLTDTYGYLRYIVEIRNAEDPNAQGVKIAENEILMLSTLVRYGKVSLKNRDVQFHRLGFDIPPRIADDIKRELEGYPKVSLYIVQNEEGKLRCYFITSSVNKAICSLHKVNSSLRSYFKK